MRIRRLASAAALLGVLWALSSTGHALAQATEPGQGIAPSENITPIGTESQPPAVENSGPLAPSPAPSPSSSRWFDNLFNQKLPVEFGFRIGESYSDNIYFQSQKTYDYITDISPSITLSLGQEIKLDRALDQETLDILTDSGNINYLHITYHPTLTLYEENSNLDIVDEYADGVYTHLFGKLTLSLEQKYEKLSQPTIQINAQGTLINRDIYTTVSRANYIYSDKLSTYGTFSQTVSDYANGSYTDNTEWSGDYYFLYQLTPKLNVGLGPRIGFDDIAQVPNQSYQDGLVHLYYVATGKFNMSGAAGAEIREYEHNSSPTEITPIVEGTAIYHPFDSMTISLEGNRHRIVANGQPGDDYTSSVGTLSVRQRFFQVVYFNASGGYENDQYSGSSLTPGGPERDDNIFFMNAGVEWTSYRGITLEGVYEYLRDDSNIKISTFTENRFTLSASVKY